MALTRIDILEHGNALNALADSDSIKGGLRTKIADFTVLTGSTFDDAETASAKGLFKAYSTIVYVTDARRLKEPGGGSGEVVNYTVDTSAAAASGFYVYTGGTIGQANVFTLTGSTPNRTALPTYWTLLDTLLTSVSGEGGTDVTLNANVTDVLTLTTQAISATDPGEADVLAGWDHSGNKFTYLSALDARTALSLGSAATTDSTAYANSAQGALADTATQPADTFYIGTTSIAHNRASGALTLAGITLSGLTVDGNLTVTGDMVQQNSTTVVFNDTFLDLNVANSTIASYTTDSGFHFARGTSGANVADEYAALTYDASADQFKFTRHGDSTTGAVANADNVAALKFAATDTNTQVDQTGGTTTMSVNDEVNAQAVRSLGAVSKCSITITSSSDANNFAPDTAGLNGYPVKHNLNTESIFVVAVKSPGGTPVPVYCKYTPEDANTVRVMLGKTVDNETYDIIVIG